MPEFLDQERKLSFVRATIFNCGSFIVGHTIEEGEDIAQRTWFSLQEYSRENPHLGLPHDLTTPTLDFARTLEPVSKQNTVLLNKLAPWWPKAGDAETPILLIAARTIMTNKQKTSAADGFVHAHSTPK